ncbi:MAG: hypothetical protein KDJ80_12170 [Nitratireductor sp.]|nr:hypothetical protein [Nitratireductor sp.]
MGNSANGGLDRRAGHGAKPGAKSPGAKSDAKPGSGPDHAARRQAGAAADASKKSEVLSYVHDMLAELRRLSVSVDEPMTTYLIEMALIEADTALNLHRTEMSASGRK